MIYLYFVRCALRRPGGGRSLLLGPCVSAPSCSLQKRLRSSLHSHRCLLAVQVLGLFAVSTRDGRCTKIRTTSSSMVSSILEAAREASLVVCVEDRGTESDEDDSFEAVAFIEGLRIAEERRKREEADALREEQRQEEVRSRDNWEKECPNCCHLLEQRCQGGASSRQFHCNDSRCVRGARERKLRDEEQFHYCRVCEWGRCSGCTRRGPGAVTGVPACANPFEFYGF